MCQNINELLPAVYCVAQDTDQHVREAACFALGQFAEFLQPTITDHYTDILPIGLALLDDPSKVIKATALSVLDEITQSMESDQVLPYLDILVTKLVNVLRTGSPQLQKMALDAVGSIAIGAKDAFLPYFPSVAELIQPFWGVTDPKFFFCVVLRSSALATWPPLWARNRGVRAIPGPGCCARCPQAIVGDEGLRVMDDDEDVLEGLNSDDEEDADDHVLRHD
ncbi:unnamed protein product [Peronospora destructor]|uniref:Importin subunit beta-1/Transportin-1-like TPR repeats domain-containing protein n=1 Tax=Peronospora destructor TaxID=86335 RepID=A0AAV0TWT8_9STRA|nr:unnamed protein product [Peronospora destructor]